MPRAERHRERVLRREPDVSGAYLVAVTGYGQADDQRRAADAGFDAHLTKPVDFEDLQELLTALPTNGETAPK